MMALKVQEKELIKEQPEKTHYQYKLNCKCLKQRSIETKYKCPCKYLF